MHKRTAILITIAAAGLALAIPIFLAIYIARGQAVEREEQRALRYAQVVLGRSERAAFQVDAAFRQLAAAGAARACDDATLALMRRLEVSSSYIGALGYMSENKVVCSSLGRDGMDLDLGSVNLVEPSGVSIRTDVKLPFSKDSNFLLIERDNFFALVNKEVPLGIVTASKDVTVGLYSVPHKRILAAHGVIRPEWMKDLRGTHQATFESGDQAVAIVAVLTSLHFYIGSIAALPTAEVDKEVLHTTKILVPIGIVASLALMLIVLQLSKFLMSMPALIKAALKHDEFSLHYQPVIDLRSGRWVGAGALIRWRQRHGEVVRPDLFIPIAEESGLIQHVTERVIRILTHDAAVILKRYPDFHIGINLTPGDLVCGTTIERLDRLAKDANAKPGNLMIEATERSLMDPEIAGQRIRELKVKGFTFAIDDFGVGYSSLSYLGHFDFDLLKIDKSFVEALDTEAATSEVVPHIIEMARALNLEMIAEGVETEAQACFLREHGVQYGQGWLFAKAMPLADLLARLDQAAACPQG